ncbi:MAG: hypothetical protein IKZ82_05700 [Clostridia bacterium]|nr:hypothetical protein [Clostridia bacterium]MBR5948125.1 hypothetical protein [Clostridia bacterium]
MECLSRYSSIMLEAALAALRSMGQDTEGARVKMPGKDCHISVYIGGVASDIDGKSARYLTQNCGIGILKSAVVRGEWLCCFVSEQFLDRCAAICAELPQAEQPKKLIVPSPDNAIDLSAVDYAIARVNTFARARERAVISAEAADALSKSFLLFDTDAEDLKRNLTAAARAAIDVCARGAIGGRHASAIARALELAQKRIVQEQ